MDLTKAAAYSDKTPYDLWQEAEEIPIVRGHCVEDLSSIPVAPWKRTGVFGSFVHLVGCRPHLQRLCLRDPSGRREQTATLSL